MSEEINKQMGNFIGRILAACDMDIPTDDLINMSDEEFRNALFLDFQKQFPKLTKEIYKDVIAYYNNNPSSLTLKDHIGWFISSLGILADKEKLEERRKRIIEFQKGNKEVSLYVLNRDLHPLHKFKEWPESIA